jgi:hypothetical protein
MIAGALALMVVVSCSPLGAGTGAEPGSIFASTPAYPGYVWTRNAQPVTPEELGTSAGPGHCGWQSATFLSIGWPPGTHSRSAAEARQYIRDPKGVTPTTLRDRLDLQARFSRDARGTGYVHDGIEIYLSPSDQDEAIYAVGARTVERWPRSRPMTLCS